MDAIAASSMSFIISYSGRNFLKNNIKIVLSNYLINKDFLYFLWGGNYSYVMDVSGVKIKKP